MAYNQLQVYYLCLSALVFVESYGWILLLVVALCLYLKSKVAPRVQQYREKLNETIENKKFGKH